MIDEHKIYERFTIVCRVAGRPDRLLAANGRERLFATMAEAEHFATASGMKPADYSIETAFCDTNGRPATRRIET
jgi:hypothetical protein